MPITLTTEHGEYTGPTLEEVIHREYGEHAFILPAGGDSPYRGTIVQRYPGTGAATVLATARHIDGEEDVTDVEEGLRAAAHAQYAVVQHDAARARLVADRDHLIRAAVAAGATKAEVCRRLGVSRSLVNAVTLGRA